MGKATLEGWRRTLGCRRHLIAQIRKIAPGVRRDYVEALLGKPKWQSTLICTRLVASGDEVKVDFSMETWPLSQMGYRVTWSESDALVMYGITTTSWWFRPRMIVGDTRIRLGKSLLSELGSPGEHQVWNGARRFGYLEKQFIGNPGGYRTWYVGVNDCGYQAVSPTRDWESGEAEAAWMPDDKRDAYRASAPINTVVVCGRTGTSATGPSSTTGLPSCTGSPSAAVRKGSQTPTCTSSPSP
ncbi:ETEC_3214 domain-containing protein [Streptomyces sp. NPDC046161]|uniref:ETEC_3214 domain-containing protein n=1 Tax=Streptomyces sp. NPDC046161 TaxID=3155132 RepID=UPI0033F239AF